jgi:acetyl-CoA acetyltransferase family protein
LYIAGGAESMTRAPYVMSKAATPFARDVQLFDTSLGWRFVNPKMKAMHGTDSMGETAENVAAQYGITRDDQDAFAVRSQQKAATARAAGIFAEEIAPVMIAQKKGDPKRVEQDEFLRPNTSMESLAKLKPAFRTDGKGSVTAGNSSGLNDGAAALLIASDRAVEEHALVPRARIVASAAVGVEPRIMGMGPVPATRRVLELAGLTLDQMDVIELNEAFAAQSLACVRELGIADDDPRVNPNGHPLGMSGARIALAATRQIQRSGARYALCTMCIGVGQGFALILERV